MDDRPSGPPLLWWNGTHVGPHPGQNLVRAGVIPTHLKDGMPQGPNGPWEFELAKAAEITRLLQLGAPMALSRSSGPRSSGPATTLPNLVAPFLAEIGLGRVAAEASAFVWAAENSVRIRRCFRVSDGACQRFYGDDFGHTGFAIHRDGRQVSEPTNPGVSRAGEFVICPPAGRLRSHCTRNEEVERVRGPGIYRAKLLPKDRFDTLDWTVLN